MAQLTRRSRGAGSIYYDDHRGVHVGLTPRLANGEGEQVRLRVQGKTREEAEARLVRLTDSLTAGKPVDSMQFGVIAERWLAQHPKARVATRKMYRWILDNELLPLWRERVIGDIDFEEVEDFLTQRAHLAASTLGKYRSTLRQIYDYAAKHDPGIRNLAKLASIPATAKKAREADALTPDEVKLILKAAENERLYPWLCVAAETGARPGEVSALTWRDLYAEERTVRLWNTKGTRVGNEKPKPRDIAISRRTVEAIEAMRVANEIEAGVSARAGKPWPPSDLIFVSSAGTPLDRHNVNRLIRAAAARAGITSKVTGYSFRHATATNLAERGKSAEELAEQLGHRDIRTAHTHYVHPRTKRINHAEGLYE